MNETPGIQNQQTPQEITTPKKVEPFTPGGTEIAGHDYQPPIPKLSSSTKEDTPTANLPKVPGFVLQKELGRGGMGIVYLARDEALKRDVAVKILLDKYVPHSRTAERFVEEAQITGQLQHPGVPAVYQIGKLDDDRPFLAMKLIKGQTLEEMIKTKQDLNVLAIFEGIAQALGYAHSHHVIHRDLKPSNVMVGSFAVVQLMDWGLAKVLPNENPTNPEMIEVANQITEIAPDRDWDDLMTQEGSILGTPAFMAPEQANGAICQIDQRTDVFGLGGILSMMLTGHPPFESTLSEDARQRAAYGKVDLIYNKLDACGAEPALIQLAKQCLAVEKAVRPANAEVVAQRVAELRRESEERAKQAEIQEVRHAIQAEEERKRFELQAQEEQKRLALQAQEERKRFELQTQESEKRRRQSARAAWVIGVVFSIGLIGTSIGLYRAYHAQEAEKQRAITEEKAKKEAVRASDIARQRFKSALESYNLMVFDIQNKLENRPGTLDLRADLLKSARAGLQKLLQEAEKQGNPDQTLIWCHFRLGDVELNLGNTPAALKEYQSGHELAKQLANLDPQNSETQPDVSISYERLGNVTLKLGQTQEALTFFQKALDIQQELAQNYPDNAQIQRLLSVSYERIGDVTFQLGQTTEALNFYQKGLEIRESLAQIDPNIQETLRDLSISYDRIGDVRLRVVQTKEALAFYQKGLEIRESLAQIDPNNQEAQSDLSISYEKLGNGTLQMGQTKEALTFFQKALEIRQRLVQNDPSNQQAQRDLSVSYDRLGDITLQLGQTRKALIFFQNGLEIRQRLAQNDPSNQQAQRDLSISYDRLGDVTLMMGPTKEALAFFQKALEIRLRVVNLDPNNPEAQRDISVSYEKLGNGTFQWGQTKEALGFYQKALEISQRLALNDPNNQQAQRALSVSYVKIAFVYQETFDFTKAEEWFEKAKSVAIGFSKPEFYPEDLPWLRSQIEWCQKAEKTVRDLDFVFQQPVESIGVLTEIRVRSLLHRQKPNEAIQTAERFAQWAEKQKHVREAHCYEAACLFSRCVTGEKPDENLIEQAIAFLEKAKADGLFTPESIPSFQQESAFDPIRTHPKFVAFIASLPSKRELLHMPKELK